EIQAAKATAIKKSLNKNVGNEPKASAESPWKAEFRQTYGLKTGEVLKRVAAPFPDSRNDFFRSLKKVYAPDVKPDTIAMIYKWDGKNVELRGLEQKVPNKPTGMELVYLLDSLGFCRSEVEIDQKL